jgi:hypothetical protein
MEQKNLSTPALLVRLNAHGWYVGKIATPDYLDSPNREIGFT